MSVAYYELMQAIRREHEVAIRLLTALNEGDDKVMPEVHAFLKKVKARKEADAHAQSAKAVNAEKRQRTGRKNSGKFEVSARVEKGVDHGATGLVLARKGDLRLIWRSGSKFWANMLEGYVYSPGNLEIEGSDARRSANLTGNHRNAGDKQTRLTKKLIEAFAERIDEAFGPGTAARVAKLEATVQVPTDD